MTDALNRYNLGRFAANAHTPSPAVIDFGASPLLCSTARQWRMILGSGIFTGHTSAQRDGAADLDLCIGDGRQAR